MVVEGEMRIEGTLDAVWAMAADVVGWATTYTGVQQVEVVARPASGMVGLRWKETRLYFGESATVEKWVTEAVDRAYFTTRAEQDGFIFTTTLRLVAQGSGVIVTSRHRTDTSTLMARLKALPMVLFRGVIRKAILEDLRDLKAAVEGTAPVAAARR
jgi:carbon monoxide dehydrogenase subunit G